MSISEKIKPRDLHITSFTKSRNPESHNREIVVSNLLTILQRKNDWHNFTWQYYCECCAHRPEPCEFRIFYELVDKGLLEIVGEHLKGEFCFTDKLIELITNYAINQRLWWQTFD